MSPEAEMGADFWRYHKEWRLRVFSLQCPGTMGGSQKGSSPWALELPSHGSRGAIGLPADHGG